MKSNQRTPRNPGNIRASEKPGTIQSAPFILHWDGTVWTRVSAPKVGLTDNLGAVAASSRNNAWAVGTYQVTASGPPLTLTYHWDGTSWNHVPSPNVGTDQNELLAVTTGHGTWAVGDDLTNPDYGTLALHYTTGGWVHVPTPNLGDGFGGTGLTGVAAVSPTEAWAVGYGQTSGGGGVGNVLSWDGTSWTVLGSPQTPDPGAFLGIAAVPTTTQAMAVGDGNSSPFSADRSSSGTWTTSSFTLPTGGVGDFTGVAWRTMNTAWAVGFRSPSDYSSEHTLIAGWDGSAWHFVPSPNPSTKNSFFGGIASAGGTSWAVGGYTNSSGVEQTLIEGSC